MTEAGNFLTQDDSNMPPAFNYYLNEIKSNMTSALNEVATMSIDGVTQKPLPDTPFLPSIEEKVIIDTIWHKNIQPLITVNWGQYYPYGEDCPNDIAGCSNTAVAMVLSYYEYPSIMELSHKGRANYLNINWPDLKKHVSSYSQKEYNNPCPESRHNAIASICREIGYRSSTKYESESSPTAIYNTITTLRGLGFVKAKLNDFKMYSVRDKFNRDNLFLMSATNVYTGKGHMWVCDGLISFSKHYKRYIRNAFQLEWQFDSDWVSDTDDHYHYNWGYDGSCNGFFIPLDFKINLYNEKRDYSSDVKYISVPRP